MTSPAAPLLQYLMQPLALWLDDDATEDIAINEPGRAWVRHHSVWDAVELPLTLADLEDIAVLAGSLRRQEVAPRAPLCATELPGGERLQICIPPCVPQGTVALSIRKPEQGVAPLSEINNRYQTADWNRCRAARAERDVDPLLALYDTAELGRFLAAATRAKLNILLCGQTGAGKTTLSKSILAAIPDTERLITIEGVLDRDQPFGVRDRGKDAFAQRGFPGPGLPAQQDVQLAPCRRSEEPAEFRRIVESEERIQVSLGSCRAAAVPIGGLVAIVDFAERCHTLLGLADGEGNGALRDARRDADLETLAARQLGSAERGTRGDFLAAQRAGEHGNVLEVGERQRQLDGVPDPTMANPGPAGFVYCDVLSGVVVEPQGERLHEVLEQRSRGACHRLRLKA